MSSLLNRAINVLPFELYIPGFQFCGPGMHLEKRLVRDDRDINPRYQLDAACREHDIAYSRSNDLAERYVANNILATKARKHIAARDSTLGERTAAAPFERYEGQDKNRHRFENEEEEESEANISGSETLWCFINPHCWGFSVHWTTELRESRK